MPSIIDPKSGKILRPDDPEFVETKLRILEAEHRDLVMAVADLQNRIARLDDGKVGWPGDTYEP